jgi:hypothetical protein
MARERTVWLVTVSAHDGVSDVTLYYSDAGYVSKPSDTPANTYFAPLLEDPGSLSRTIFAGGTTQGRVEVGYGAVVLSNMDGALDALKDYGYGRSITIQSITARDPETEPLTSAVTRFVGVVSHPEADFEQLRFIIRDQLGLLDTTLQGSEFDGTSTGPTGIEGNANVAGNVKPMAFGGALRNISPVLVNSAKEVFGWNFDRAGSTKGSSAVSALRNGGASYSLSGTDHSSESALFGATVAGSTADTALGLSLLRTSGSVDSALTADVTVSTTVTSAAQVAAAILAEHGYTIDAASVSALDALNSAPVGLYFDSRVTVLDAAQQALESVGGYLIATAAGAFVVGRFEAPTGDAVKAIEEWEVLDDGSDRAQLVPTEDGTEGVPAYKLALSYSPNWTTQTTLKGSVTPDDVERWKRAALRVVVQDPAVQTQHPEAREVEVPTALVDVADATAEANRRLAFLKSATTRLRVPLAASRAVRDADGKTPLDIGDHVSLELSRFGFSTPGSFVLIGVEERFGDNVVTLDLVNSSAW